MLALALTFALGCASEPSAPSSSAPDAPAHAVAPAEATPAAGQRSDVDIGAFHAAHAGGVKVLDVRTEAEFAAGHVPGALNVPLDQVTASEPRLQGLAKDGPLYVICEVGGRSSQASDALAAMGFQAVNVQGGTRAWRDAGYPTE